MENNVAYKDIKNYIHNELGITKECIQQIIVDTIRIEVNKRFNDEEFIKNEMKRIISKELSKEVCGDSSFHTIHDFTNIIKDEINNAILDEVKSRLDITLKDKQ